MFPRIDVIASRSSAIREMKHRIISRREREVRPHVTAMRIVLHGSDADRPPIRKCSGKNC